MLLRLIIVPVASIVALFTALFFYLWIRRQDPGNQQVQRIAGYIREGAMAYLRQQYKTAGLFFIIVFLILVIFSFGFNILSRFVPFCFLTGAFFSGLSGFFGMLTSTMSSNRTTHAASKSLNQALRISFRGGSVMGLVVVGFALFCVIAWFLIMDRFIPEENLALKYQLITTTLLSFGVGASAMALFARVGGGIFTKAADMGADLVGKVEAGIPEDDPRNPAVIADNVGDNVGDVAGMGADLFESFVGSILGTAVLAVAAFPLGQAFNGVILPMIIAGIGTLASIAGIFSVRTSENLSQKGLLAAINRGINLTTLITIAFSAVTITILFPDKFWALFIPLLAGMAAGVAIGYVTDLYTNAAYAPVQGISRQAKTGHATVITSGLSVGLFSTAPVVVFIIMGMLVAFLAGNGFHDFSLGLYAVGLAAVGMLATLGINLSTDAFGPIADNAGGIAEMADMPSETRLRTDALDELGNSTAARGKGLCIGAAALTAVTLIAAFLETIRSELIRMGETTIEIAGNMVDIVSVEVIDILAYLGGSIMDIRFIVGLFIGGALTTTFSSKTIEAVSLAAGEMIDEVRRQFREIKGIMTGKTTPDYSQCVKISTAAAQKKMLSPALTAILAPIITGLILGPIGIVGLLLGNLLLGFFFAVFMANSGGAWDNAKKFIERSKSELKFKISDGIKRVTHMGLWPFFLTRDYSKFLYELVNMNPLAFSIDEKVSDYLADIIDYLETEYIKKDKSLEVPIKRFGGKEVSESDDETLNALYRKLNQEDRQIFKLYLKLKPDEHQTLMEMKDLRAKFTVVMSSYSAAVTGDTVGDPLKDTTGPSLDIAIKLSTMVSIIVIGFILRFNLIDYLTK
ncbi:MAG TPA: sodium-translocating pyrophosphatase [Candidatus Marinimicrobia bacterium]|nr:sodium-translocating pyrophosphatase [Candidatus Neomarinimicrobiota bacterium]